MMDELRGPGIYGPPLPDRLPASDPGLTDAGPRPARQTTTVPAGVSSQTSEYDLPVGTRSLGFTWGSGLAAGLNIAVTGLTTGTVYMDLNMKGLAYKVCPVFSVADPSVKLSITNLNNTPATITAVAIPDNEGVIIVGETGTLIPAVFLRDSSANFINSDPNPVGPWTSLSVSLSKATPAPWQAPASKLVNTANTVAATYKNILPAVGAAVQLYLHYARFDLDAVSGGVFAVSTDGLTANVFVINDNGKGPYILGPFGGGEPQGLNSGLWVFTTNIAVVRYHVSYSTQ